MALLTFIWESKLLNFPSCPSTLFARADLQNLYNKKRAEPMSALFIQSCKFVTDYRTFMKDFLKVVDFLHYLKAEGYDMVTFEKVRDDL